MREIYKLKLALVMLSLLSLELNAQWTPHVSGTSDLLFDLYFTNDSTAYTCGFGGSGCHVLKTTNKGLSWTSTALPGGTAISHAYQIKFFDDLNGIVTADDAACSCPVIYKTNNAGATWS
jgi:photosystem II stability/assembly factor-like uncharacterized protein